MKKSTSISTIGPTILALRPLAKRAKNPLSGRYLLILQWIFCSYDQFVRHYNEHNELVLVSGKTLGPRQMKVYYDQRHRDRSHQQLVSSLMQEHRRLEAIERQKRTYVPQTSIRLRQQIDFKAGMKANNQKHYRNSNPL
jgi:hypothetical protein